MKLSPRWSMHKGVLDINEAIAVVCDDDRDGLAESAMASARATGEMLGKIVELLHSKGVLKDEDVLALLPGWEAA